MRIYGPHFNAPKNKDLFPWKMLDYNMCFNQNQNPNPMAFATQQCHPKQTLAKIIWEDSFVD